MRRLPIAVLAVAAICGVAPLSRPAVAADFRVAADGVIESTRRRLVVPFEFDAAQLRSSGAVAVDLLVSVDGAAFVRHLSVPTTERQFVFEAPADATYAFCVRTRDAAGTPMPGGPPTPGLTVRVVSAAVPAAANRAMSLDPPRGVELLPPPDEHTLAASQTAPTRLAASPDPAASPSPARTSATVSPAATSAGVAASLAEVAPSLSPPAPAAGPIATPVLAQGPQSGTTTRQTPIVPARTASLSVPVIDPAGTAAAASPTRWPAIDAATSSALEFGSPAAAAMQPAPYGGPMETGVPSPSVVGSGRFELNFEVEDVGPSGVRQVALYITEDGGHTWFHYGNDADGRSPFSVSVPRDGEYGFAFRVTSGVGVVSPPPQPGESPEIALSVDTTPPSVRASQPTLQTAHGTSEVVVRWEMDDANAVARPISLDVSTSASGPWTEIAASLPDSGRFVWAADGTTFPSAFFRVRAVDAAGHIAVATTNVPLILDASRPRARFTAVRPLPQ